jgi:porin
MREKFDPTIRGILTAAFVLSVGIAGHAQGNETSLSLPEPPPAARSIEDLNYLGGDAAFPPFSDNLIPVDSSYRQAMFRHGVAFRVNAGPGYTQNVLDAPVDRHEQVYVGQAPFWSMWAQPILTADLRQLHLRRTQLFMGAVWNWVTWDPAGPKTLQMWNLHLYKVLGEDRVQIKAVTWPTT